jgi:hypothetical protein
MSGLYDDLDLNIKSVSGDWAKVAVTAPVVSQLRPPALQRRPNLVSASVAAVVPVPPPPKVVAASVSHSRAQSASALRSLGLEDVEDAAEDVVAAPPKAAVVNAAEVEATKQRIEVIQKQQQDVDTYDPAKPNDYELICVERKKVAEAEKRLKAVKEGTIRGTPIGQDHPRKKSMIMGFVLVMCYSSISTLSSPHTHRALRPHAPSLRYHARPRQNKSARPSNWNSWTAKGKSAQPKRRNRSVIGLSGKPEQPNVLLQ